MKRIAYVLPVIALLFLGACTLRMSATQTPTAIVLSTDAPLETAAPVNAVVPVVSEAAPVETVVQVMPVVSEVPTQAPPTQAPASPGATSTAQDPQAAASKPSATAPAPTATPLPAGAFDPFTTFGKPTYENPMDFPNMWEWAPPETNTLPNNSRIRLQFKDGELYVTGKHPEFSTWWFSSHFLNDAYQQLTFNTEDCSDEDAYGMILRGPSHLSGPAYGYVVYFTCSGKMGAFRLDDAQPWNIEELLDSKPFEAINSGAGVQNVLGVNAVGDTFTIYANGVKVGEFQDDHFSKGRFGVFVRAARPDAYTYRVTNLAYWDLSGE
jgi:hypothetical protein